MLKMKLTIVLTKIREKCSKISDFQNLDNQLSDSKNKFEISDFSSLDELSITLKNEFNISNLKNLDKLSIQDIGSWKLMVLKNSSLQKFKLKTHQNFINTKNGILLAEKQFFFFANGLGIELLPSLPLLSVCPNKNTIQNAIHFPQFSSPFSSPAKCDLWPPKGRGGGKGGMRGEGFIFPHNFWLYCLPPSVFSK